MMRLKIINTLVVFLVGIILAGCGLNSGYEGVISGTLESEVLIPTNSMAVVDEDQPLPTTTKTMVIETPAEVHTPTPTVGTSPRTELSATDPLGIVLKSGNVQLFEFFAFW